jgi:SAM-dependent methyltransferase
MTAGSLLDNGRRLFDHTRRRLIDLDVQDAMNDLFTGLDALRASVDRPTWRRFVTTVPADEPLLAMLTQDPITGRSRTRPRGYPGDAALLDLIYGTGPLPAQTSCLGAAIYGVTVQVVAAQVVRTRLRTLVDILNATAERVSRPRALSVACGHLRESQLSVVADGRFGSVYALDQDAETLGTVEREQSSYGVKVDNSSVRAILTGDVRYDGLDLVYSAGLYDYLPRRTAVALTARLYRFLRPGGRLIIANLRPGLPETAYMEMFMSWHLIYRDDRQLLELAGELPKARVFRDADDRVGYLEIIATAR